MTKVKQLILGKRRGKCRLSKLPGTILKGFTVQVPVCYFNNDTLNQYLPHFHVMFS